MKSRLLEFEELLNQLEGNGCSYVKIAPDVDLEWDSLEGLELNIKGSCEGVHHFGAITVRTVDMVGSREDFRKLGLLLIMRGLTYSRKDMYLRLLCHDKSPVNAITLNGLSFPPDIFDLTPYAVVYQAMDIPSPYLRNDGYEACSNLPAFGVVDDSISIRTSYELPSWINHAIAFSNSANSCLRLGKLLLDFSHPSNTIDEVHLEPVNHAVSPISYEANFWLLGSFGDDDAYC